MPGALFRELDKLRCKSFKAMMNKSFKNFICFLTRHNHTEFSIDFEYVMSADLLDGKGAAIADFNNFGANLAEIESKFKQQVENKERLHQ